MLIAEELYLLLFHPDGSLSSINYEPDPMLAGALVADLAKAEAIELSDAKKPIVSLTGIRPTHPALQQAVDSLAAHKRPATLYSLVSESWFKPRKAIGRGLAAQGIAKVIEPKMLGMVAERYWMTDQQMEVALHQRLADVVLGKIAADDNDIALFNILKAASATALLKPKEMHLTKREMDRAITQIVESYDSPAYSKAVKQALQAIQASMAAAVVVVTS